MSDVDVAARVRDLRSLLDGWLAFQRWFREMPSLAVGISVGDETVLAKGSGLADVDAGTAATEHTRYRIASHSKVFTATALMQLVADGAVRLDDPVASHLAWFRSGNDDELRHVTIRHLLCHASGLTRDGATTHWHDDRFPTLDELVDQVEHGFHVLETVDRIKYSNIAFTVAGQVIEAITGRPYEEHVTRTILEPLGLAETTPDLPDDLTDHAVGYTRRLPDRPRQPLDHVHAGVMNSATGFSSSVVDLLRWYQAHLFESGHLLPDRLKREMQRLQFEGPDTRWGLGFSLARHGGLDFAVHGGGYPGFITYSGLNQKHRLAIVVLTNAIDGPAWAVFDGVAKLVAKAVDGELGEAGGLDVESADGVVGFYESRWAIDLIERVGQSMVSMQPALPDPVAGLEVLEHVDGLRFRYPHTFPVASPGEEVWFEPGDPPTMHAPATPPTPRTTYPLD